MIKTSLILLIITTPRINPFLSVSIYTLSNQWPIVILVTGCSTKGLVESSAVGLVANFWNNLHIFCCGKKINIKVSQSSCFELIGDNRVNDQEFYTFVVSDVKFDNPSIHLMSCKRCGCQALCKCDQ